MGKISDFLFKSKYVKFWRTVEVIIILIVILLITSFVTQKVRDRRFFKDVSEVTFVSVAEYSTDGHPGDRINKVTRLDITVYINENKYLEVYSLGILVQKYKVKAGRNIPLYAPFLSEKDSYSLRFYKEGNYYYLSLGDTEYQLQKQ